MNEMQILVTGGAGFIGSNLALELEKLGHTVTIADNLFSGTMKNLNDFKGEFLNWDVSCKPLPEKKFDIIFHEAAITDPRHDNDDETYSKNINGFYNIIELALRDNAKLIYASSASVYGNTKIPMIENQDKDTFSAYAKSKLKMDDIAELLFNEMHIIGLRYFNVFGPRETHKGRPASMIFHLRNQILKGLNPRLFEFGEQVRDHIYVKDVITANLIAVNAKSGVYNVGTGIGTDFNYLVNILNSVLKTNKKIEYFKNPYNKNYQANTIADTTKAENILGFKSEYSFKEGVIDYHNFLNENVKPTNEKIISIEVASTIAQKLKSQGKTIVTINGSFDIFHYGHVYILQEAKKQGDVLILLLNTDNAVKMWKKHINYPDWENRPINNQDVRAKTIAALECIDYIVLFDELTPINYLNQIKPDIHVNGSEYGKDCIERDVVVNNGGKIYIVDKIENFSSTELLKKIARLYNDKK